jgi:Protein of unknown function (DUF3179)
MNALVSPPRLRWIWILFAPTAVVAIGMFCIPAFIIRPFSYQSPRGLVWAMAIRDRAPWATLIAALVCLLFAALLWIGASRGRKIAIGMIMALVAFSAVMARLNYFEWMFHPVKSALFESAAASKLDKSDMIMAVRFGSDARAYPIREMAYHHILNDTVNGVPIAVTY